MSVDLIYKHQQRTHELMKQSLQEKGRAAYVFPVGCGKSFPVLKYIEENPDKTVLFVYPNTEIKLQFLDYVSKYILDGQKVIKETFPRLRCISYSKLSLLEDISDIKPDVVVFDEFHRAETGGKWEEGVERLLENNPKAEIIGMTATPERTDGRNALEEKFEEDIVYEMSLTDALSGEKEGEVVLNGARYVRVISELGKRLEEYREKIKLVEDETKRKELEEKYEKLESIVSKAPGIEDVMEQGMQKKNGKYIVFCKDSQDMFEKMEQASTIFGKVNSNIRMDYVLSKGEGREGKTPAQNRRTIEEFKKREESEELQLLFCVDMLNEGVHIKGISGEVMFRPTESKIVYKQQIGRVMTSDEEAEETVIIDAVNNWYRQIDAYNEIERAIQKGQKDKEEYDLLRLSPEELELLDVLRQIDEASGVTIHNTYEEIIEWLETHDGKMPRSEIVKGGKSLKREEMAEEERLEVNLYQRWSKTSIEKKILDKYAGRSIKEVPEEYREKIAILRNYGLGQKEKTTYEEIIEFLKTHDGKMPRGEIKKGQKREEMTEEEKNEINLYQRWNKTTERKILDEYAGKQIKEVPEEYREKISTLRSYGLGSKEKTTYEEIIVFLDTHDGKMPRGIITNSGKKLKREEMAEEEKNEINLYARWRNSKEKKVLDQYVGRPIEEVPEEYREKIVALRSYGLGQEEKTTYEELIEFLEEHDGKMPRDKIVKNKKVLKREELTEEESKEVKLYGRWKKSSETKILDEYEGRSIEEVPEEYREKIATLRNYGLGQKEKTAYEELIEFLEKHDGKMPRDKIRKDKKILKREKLTEEESKEVKLYGRWKISKEKRLLDEFLGIPIEEVPEEYSKMVETLRSYGLGQKEKTTYEELIEWLEIHDKNMPRGILSKDGKKLKAEEMTEEERIEVNLYQRWNKASIEKKILDEYAGMPIEEVPEEYREKIATLRSYGIMGKKKDQKIKDKMKKSVGKHVEDNEEIRKELEEIEKDKKAQETIDD